MENKIKVQRTKIKKFLTFCQSFIKAPEAKSSTGYIEGKIQMINTLWAKIDSVNDVINEADTTEYEITAGPKAEASLKEMQKEYEAAFDMYDKVTVQMHIDIEKLNKEKGPQLQPLQLPENLTLNTNKSNIKLKQIDVPVFTGDYKKWISFKNMFDSMIHNNNEFNNLQKMHYLKSCLEGEAERLISQYDVTNESYEPAYNMINERYHNEVILIDEHIISILSQDDLKSESSNGLKMLLDVTTENLRALKSLQVDTDAWDPILLLLLVQKLDASTRRLWEQNLKPKVRPTMREFLDFLANRFHALGCQQKFKFSMESAAERTDKKSFSYVNRNQPSNDFKSRSEESLFPPRTHQSFHNSTESLRRCPFRCSESHDAVNCGRFIRADILTRRDLVTCAKLCRNCLRNHRGKCSQPPCHKCNNYHHNLLHFEKAITSNSLQSSSTISNHAQTQSANQNTTAGTNLQAHHVHVEQDKNVDLTGTDKKDSEIIAWDEKVLLATAIVLVRSNRDGMFHPFRALIDKASEASYASELLVQTLGLVKKSVFANTTGLGGNTTGTINYVVDFEVSSKKNPAFNMKVQGPVVSKVTNPLPSTVINRGDWRHIKGLHLADPHYEVPGRIDLLLGAPVYGYLMLPGLIKASPEEPVAQNTEFGWILSGPVRHSPKERSISTFHLKIDLDQQLRKFFEQEEVVKERVLTQEEVACEKFYMETFKRAQDGRFIVALPFKSNPEKLGSSKGQAISRLTNLERRFRQNESLKREYTAILEEYEELEHTTHLGSLNEQWNAPSYYLPHHAVFKPSSTSTKTRIVFDASAKSTSGVSLNDVLMTGPTLQQDLMSILLRWRTFRFVFTADIAKMYRQVQVREEDRKYQKFVYRKDEKDEIHEYQHNMVTFGVTSATYLAVKSLQQLAVEEATNFPEAAEIVLRDFYMDDGMSGAESEKDCIKICRDLKELLSRGKFELRKFIANSAKVLESIPERDRELTLPMEINLDNSVKTLGIHYHPTSDEFQFKITLEETNEWPTKRSLLSETSKLFDPLGWLAPVIIKAKIMFQSLWQAGLTWDQGLPVELANTWMKFRNELHCLQQTRIKRWTGNSSQASKIELHGFSDASEAAFSAVIYSRVINRDNSIKVTMLTSKTRVAPIKPVTLPRLELCGLVLLANLMEVVKKSIEVKSEDIHAWTDSTVVLGWLRTNPSRLKTFVANRVVEVHDTFNVNQCHHIEGTENPADCASRGIDPSELIDHKLWWHGPECLKENRSSWSQELEIPEATLELKIKYVSTYVITADDGLEGLIARYSNFDRLIRITAICLKFLESSHNTRKSRVTALCLTFINNLRSRNQRSQLLITTRDLRKAEKRIIKLCQGKFFDKEIHHLACKQPINKKSKILQLNPFLDVNGCLRVGGRLDEAKLPYERKHPLILPEGSIAKLIIASAHDKAMHGGIKLTMNIVRERFWIINLRRQVKKHILDSVKCCRFNKWRTG